MLSENSKNLQSTLSTKNNRGNTKKIEEKLDLLKNSDTERIQKLNEGFLVLRELRAAETLEEQEEDIEYYFKWAKEIFDIVSLEKHSKETLDTFGNKKTEEREDHIKIVLRFLEITNSFSDCIYLVYPEHKERFQKAIEDKLEKIILQYVGVGSNLGTLHMDWRLTRKIINTIGTRLSFGSIKLDGTKIVDTFVSHIEKSEDYLIWQDSEGANIKVCREVFKTLKTLCQKQRAKVEMAISSGRFDKNLLSLKQGSLIFGEDGGLFLLLNRYSPENEEILKSNPRITREYILGKTDKENRIKIGEGSFGTVKFAMCLFDNEKCLPGEVICVKKTKSFEKIAKIKLQVEPSMLTAITDSTIKDYFAGDVAEIIRAPIVYDLALLNHGNLKESQKKGYLMMEILPQNTADKIFEKANFRLWEFQKPYSLGVLKSTNELLGMLIVFTDLKPPNTLFDTDLRKPTMIDLGGTIKLKDKAHIRNFMPGEEAYEFTKEYCPPELNPNNPNQINLEKSMSYICGKTIENVLKFGTDLDESQKSELDSVVTNLKLKDPVARIEILEAIKRIEKIGSDEYKRKAIFTNYIEKLKSRLRNNLSSLSLNENIYETEQLLIKMKVNPQDPTIYKSKKAKPLFDVLEKFFARAIKKKVLILLGSAGSGKSIALQLKFINSVTNWKLGDPLPMYFNLANETDIKKIFLNMNQELSSNIEYGETMDVFIDSFDEGVDIDSKKETLFQEYLECFGPDSRFIISCRSEFVEGENFPKWFDASDGLIVNYIIISDWNEGKKKANKDKKKDKKDNVDKPGKMYLFDSDGESIVEDSDSSDSEGNYRKLDNENEQIDDENERMSLSDSGNDSFEEYFKEVDNQNAQAGYDKENMSFPDGTYLEQCATRWLKYHNKAHLLESYIPILLKSNVKSIIDTGFSFEIIMQIIDVLKVENLSLNKHLVYKLYVESHVKISVSQLNDEQTKKLSNFLYVLRSKDKTENLLELVLKLCHLIAIELALLGRLRLDNDNSQLFTLLDYNPRKSFKDQTLHKALSLLPLKIETKKVLSNIYKIETIQIGFKHDTIKSYFMAESIVDYAAENEPSPILYINNICNDREFINFFRIVFTPKIRELLIGFLFKTREDKSEMAGVLASNSITLLTISGETFSCSDLSGVRIKGANLTNNCFNNTNFTEADLEGVDFRHCELDFANFTRANLKDVKLDFFQIELDREKFKSIHNFGTSLNGNFVVSKFENWLAICDVTTGEVLKEIELKNDQGENVKVQEERATKTPKEAIKSSAQKKKKKQGKTAKKRKREVEKGKKKFKGKKQTSEGSSEEELSGKGEKSWKSEYSSEEEFSDGRRGDSDDGRGLSGYENEQSDEELQSGGNSDAEEQSGEIGLGGSEPGEQEVGSDEADSSNEFFDECESKKTDENNKDEICSLNRLTKMNALFALDKIGKYLVINDKNNICVWNLKDDPINQEWTFGSTEKIILSIAISGNGEILTVGYENNLARIFYIKSQSEAHHISFDIEDGDENVGFNHIGLNWDGTVLAACCNRGLLGIWNAITGSFVRKISFGDIKCDNLAYELKISSNGDVLAFSHESDSENEIKIWTSKIPTKVSPIYKGARLDFSLSSDGKILGVSNLLGGFFDFRWVFSIFSVTTKKKIQTIFLNPGKDCFSSYFSGLMLTHTAFSENGEKLIGCYENKIIVYDLTTMKKLKPFKRFKTFDNGVNGLGFLNQDKWFFAKCFCNYKIWDFQTGNFLKNVEFVKMPEFDEISSDGKYIAMYRKKCISIYDIEADRIAIKLDDVATNLALSEDGTLLATYSKKGIIKLWNVWEKELKVSFPEYYDYDCQKLLLSGDGEFILAKLILKKKNYIHSNSKNVQKIVILCCRTATEVFISSSFPRNDKKDFNLIGLTGKIAFLDLNDEYFLWKRGGESDLTKKLDFQNVSFAFISKDEEKLVFGSNYASICFFDIRTENKIFKFLNNMQFDSNGVILSSDLSKLILSKDKNIYLYKKGFNQFISEQVDDFIYSSNYRLRAYPLSEKVLVVLDKSGFTFSDDSGRSIKWDKKNTKKVKNNTKKVREVCLDFPELYLAAIFFDFTFEIYEKNTGERCFSGSLNLRIQDLLTNPYLKFVFDSQTKTISTITSDNKLQVWPIPCDFVGYTKHKSCLENLTFYYESSPFTSSSNIMSDGRIALGSTDSIIRIWDLTQNTVAEELKGHNDSIIYIRVCQKGNTLASVSKDDKIGLWNLNSRTSMKFLEIGKGKGKIFHIEISPKGEHLAGLFLLFQRNSRQLLADKPFSKCYLWQISTSQIILEFSSNMYFPMGFRDRVFFENENEIVYFQFYKKKFYLDQLSSVRGKLKSSMNYETKIDESEANYQYFIQEQILNKPISFSSKDCLVDCAYLNKLSELILSKKGGFIGTNIIIDEHKKESNLNYITDQVQQESFKRFISDISRLQKISVEFSKYFDLFDTATRNTASHILHKEIGKKITQEEGLVLKSEVIYLDNDDAQKKSRRHLACCSIF